MSINNTMTLIGNIAADPELRYTTQGKPVCNFRLASDERVQVDGEWESRPTFLTVVVFGQPGENVANLHKGDRLVVIGRVRTRTYRPEDGETRYYTEVIADEVAASLKWADVEVHKNAPRDDTPAEVGVEGAEEPF